MKKSMYLFKSITLSFFVLYIFNLMAESINFSVPISLFSILFVSIFGFNGFITLIILMIYVF